MATIDELLDGPALPDVDEVILVDPAKREAVIPSDELVLGVAGDKKSECKYFKMPRVVGNDIDVTACDLRVMYKNLTSGDDGYFTVKQMVNDNDNVVFCWEVSETATKEAGNVEFSVCVCKTINGMLHNEWQTTPAVGIVKRGLGDIKEEVELAKTDNLGRAEDAANRAEGAASAAQDFSNYAGTQAEVAEQSAVRAETAADDAFEAAEVAIAVVDEAVKELTPPMIVTITEPLSGMYVSDKTYEEILEAYVAKRRVYAYFFGVIYSLLSVDDEWAECAFFTSISGDQASNSVFCNNISILKDNSVIISYAGGALLPFLYGDEDNGKMMKVVDGVWTAVPTSDIVADVLAALPTWTGGAY